MRFTQSPASIHGTLCGILLVFLAAAPAAADTIRPLEPSSEPIHIRVLFEQNPANEAVISWTTTGPERGESHVVYVDTEPREGELDAYAQSLPSIQSHPYSLRDDEEEAGMHAWSHNVLLEDLEPATRYYLTVMSDGEQSDEFYFITAPDDDRDVKLLLVGDSRVGGARTHSNNNRRRVNALMRDLFEEHPDIVAMAHGADYTNRAYWSQLYFWLNDHHEKTTTSDGRLMPIIPSRGNHDLDVGFEEMFWWPDRENDYYYTTWLSGSVPFITLNSEISIGGDQRDWLADELERVRPHARWLTGQWHRPAYPSVRDYNASRTISIRETWVPLFEQYAMDLGYEAHDHALKRTYPIANGQIDEVNGIIYIGDGGGGVSQRQPDPSRWYLEVTGRHHHAHLVTFGESEIHTVAIDIDHNIIDEFVIDGGLRLLAGLSSPEAFSRRLTELLGDPSDPVRAAGHQVLQAYVTHLDLDAPRDRTAFLAQMRELFENTSQPAETRRLAYQILLLHADHENGEARALLDRGREDGSEAIRELALIIENADLEHEVGRRLIQTLGTRGADDLREEALREMVSQPRVAFPDDRDADEFEQVDAFELPREGWRLSRDRGRVGYFLGWHEPGFDDSSWQQAEIGDFWRHFLDEMYVGVGWYRATIEVPELSDHDALGLHFGGVDEQAWVWIDGEYVGEHSTTSEGLESAQLWDRPFQIDVTDVVTPGQTHQITIRAMNTGANGGVWEPVELRAYRERD